MSQKFIVGDRVVYVGRHPHVTRPELLGKVGTVVEHEDLGTNVLFQGEKRPVTGLLEENLDFVYFKRGDRVRYTGRAETNHQAMVWKQGTVTEDLRPGTNRVVVDWDEKPAFARVYPQNLELIVPDKVEEPEEDAVNHPSHYTSHPSGIECIQITEHMSFCLGNAVKYIWRADLKGNDVEDLKKARFYIDREIAKREASK